MRRADNFTHLHVQIFLKYGGLKLLEPSGPVQACNGIAFTTSWRSYRKLKYSLELTLESTGVTVGRGQLKCDGTHAETDFVFQRKGRVHLNRPVRGGSVQSTTGSRGVRISGSNAGYTMFRGGVKSTGYPLHSPVSPSLPPPRASPCAITFQLESATTCFASRFMITVK